MYNEGKRIKATELFTDFMEQSGFHDADRYIEDVPPQEPQPQNLPPSPEGQSTVSGMPGAQVGGMPGQTLPTGPNTATPPKQMPVSGPPPVAPPPMARPFAPTMPPASEPGSPLPPGPIPADVLSGIINKNGKNKAFGAGAAGVIPGGAGAGNPVIQRLAKRHKAFIGK